MIGHEGHQEKHKHSKNHGGHGEHWVNSYYCFPCALRVPRGFLNFIFILVFLVSFVANLYISNSGYSHSIVPGGFPVTSYTTREIPSTSLTIRLVT